MTNNIINSALKSVKYGLQGLQNEVRILKNSSQSNIQNIKFQNNKLIKEVKFLKSNLGKTISKIANFNSNKKTHKRRTHKRRK